MARPTHPEQEPDRPGHPATPDRPGRPGHPDQELPEPEKPEKPQPKGGRAVARDATEPATAVKQLLPPAAAVGDPSFVLRVVGSGFDETSVIVFAGEEEPTTFVSDVELTTGVDMAVWLGADPAIPVLVRTASSTSGTGSEDSNTVDFAFTAPREEPLPEAHASIPVPTMDLITPM